MALRSCMAMRGEVAECVEHALRFLGNRVRFGGLLTTAVGSVL